jgi:hypothetical protein
MNRTMAVQIDKKSDVYVDTDEGMHCVFGADSGFCYATFADGEEAETYATNLRVQLGIPGHTAA